MQIVRTKLYQIIVNFSSEISESGNRPPRNAHASSFLFLFLFFIFKGVSDFKQTRYTMPFPLDKRASLP